MITARHGLDGWLATLADAPDALVDKLKRTTGRACNNIKKDAQKRVRGYPHLPHLARSFTYTVTADRNQVRGEVGAEQGRLQGKLDVFIEFGTPTSAPIPHWRPAADAEIPTWESYCAAACAEVLGDRPGRPG